ncbi:unnamed protein product [Linum tenue]|uniref:F-box domain-containing protein n=2 Tax=Linum tenue TaxID=586396 RepID=A0AAV0N7J0_9ROSI|nr:unnamed protein product [Linum tenue]
MPNDEVLKTVFPLLNGIDLASCMAVSKQWRDIARDDYFWKCQCAKRWPSICKRPNLSTTSYYRLYQSFYKRQNHQILLPPKLSFDTLEFYIDIWAGDKLIYSGIVQGSVFEDGIKLPPHRISSVLRYHLQATEYKMMLAVEPTFKLPLSQPVSVSVLVGRKDSNKIARIIHKAMFDYIDRSSYRAMAFDAIDISPMYRFLPNIRGWISLLFMEGGDECEIDVFGIQMDFNDVANSKDEVLWLLDMLDWK